MRESSVQNHCTAWAAACQAWSPVFLRQTKKSRTCMPGRAVKSSDLNCHAFRELALHDRSPVFHPNSCEGGFRNIVMTTIDRIPTIVRIHRHSPGEIVRRSTIFVHGMFGVCFNAFTEDHPIHLPLRAILSGSQPSHTSYSHGHEHLLCLNCTTFPVEIQAIRGAKAKYPEHPVSSLMRLCCISIPPFGHKKSTLSRAGVWKRRPPGRAAICSFFVSIEAHKCRPLPVESTDHSIPTR